MVCAEGREGENEIKAHTVNGMIFVPISGFEVWTKRLKDSSRSSRRYKS